MQPGSLASPAVGVSDSNSAEPVPFDAAVWRLLKATVMSGNCKLPIADY